MTISGTGFSKSVANNSVTVDGNDCKVTASDSNEIRCTLAEKSQSINSQLKTNSSNQTNGFFAGAGLKYARYSRVTAINTIAKFVDATRTANTSSLGTPLEEGFRADIREPDIYGSYYLQSWRGYFTAPATGTYTFRGEADDQFALYISSTYGTAEPSVTPLIEQTTWNRIWSGFYKYKPTANAQIDLVQGRSYYIETYHMNYGGPG